jgi:hypothetical protein
VSTQTKFNYGQSVVSLALDTFFCRNVYAHIRVPLYHFPVSWWIGPVWIPLDLSKYDLTSSMGNGEIAQEGVTNRRDQVVTRRVDNLISGENVRITSPWAITSWGTTGWPESSTVRLLDAFSLSSSILRLIQVADLSLIGFPSSSSRPFLCFVRHDHHTSMAETENQTYCFTSNRVTVKPRA